MVWAANPECNRYIPTNGHCERRFNKELRAGVSGQVGYRPVTNGCQECDRPAGHGSSLTVNGLGSSAVEVAAAPPPVDLGPELALELHEAPDLGGVGAEVGFDVGGRLADGGQVEAEQLHA